MKKIIFTLLACLVATCSFAGSILNEGFEYANHDLERPVGWTCDDNSWLCGYLEKDHNRLPHSGNWYAFSDADDAWMFMPMYLLESMKYRFTLWAITDGEFQFEIWAGSAPRPDGMHAQFYATAIDKDEYGKISAYVETIPPDCQYFGFHAVALNGASHLTIDDIEVDMVEQYTFDSQPITGETAMYPGSQATFRFLVENTGYDALDITAHPSNEYFTDFTCTVNGEVGMTFHTEPSEIVEVAMTATLRPEVEPGTVAWLDILMTIPCNCNTAMVTFWVTPLDPTSTDENNALEINVFPNPVSDYITIEGEGLNHFEILDITGKVIEAVQTNKNKSSIDLSSLKSGLYVISIETDNGVIRRVFIKQ